MNDKPEMHKNELKEWLNENHYSPENLASKAGVSFSTVQRAMAGIRVGSQSAKNLMKVTGISEWVFRKLDK